MYCFFMVFLWGEVLIEQLRNNGFRPSFSSC